MVPLPPDPVADTDDTGASGSASTAMTFTRTDMIASPDEVGNTGMGAVDDDDDDEEDVVVDDPAPDPDPVSLLPVLPPSVEPDPLPPLPVSSPSEEAPDGDDDTSSVNPEGMERVSIVETVSTARVRALSDSSLGSDVRAVSAQAAVAMEESSRAIVPTATAGVVTLPELSGVEPPVLPAPRPLDPITVTAENSASISNARTAVLLRRTPAISEEVRLDVDDDDPVVSDPELPKPEVEAPASKPPSCETTARVA